MLKRMLIVMGLLGMGIVAGFVVFVASSTDDRLRAQGTWCPWEYSEGTTKPRVQMGE